MCTAFSHHCLMTIGVKSKGALVFGKCTFSSSKNKSAVGLSSIWYQQSTHSCCALFKRSAKRNICWRCSLIFSFVPKFPWQQQFCFKSCACECVLGFNENFATETFVLILLLGAKPVKSYASLVLFAEMQSISEMCSVVGREYVQLFVHLELTYWGHGLVENWISMHTPSQTIRSTTYTASLHSNDQIMERNKMKSIFIIHKRCSISLISIERLIVCCCFQVVDLFYSKIVLSFSNLKN